MNYAHNEAILPDEFNAASDPTLDFERRKRSGETSSTKADVRQNGLLQFFAELRRRHVCRAATMYAIAFWLICQVVELIAPELKLPEWTLRLVIVFGLIGFPIALVFSWLVDITPGGVVVDHDREPVEPRVIDAPRQRPIDRAIDGCLVLAALVIASQLMIGSFGGDPDTDSIGTPRIAVLPFRIASGSGADTLAEGLIAELQHELTSRAGATVIAPEKEYLGDSCFKLSGAVGVHGDIVRVTATIVDNDTGEVTWTRVFQQPIKDSLAVPATLARDIVSALPIPHETSRVSESEPPENKYHAT